MNKSYEILDPAFRSLMLPSSELFKLSGGHLWTEGPVWVPAHQSLYFSDIPNNRLLRWTPDGQISVFRDRSEFANGNTLDRQGRLITCQHGTRSVTRTAYDGTIETLCDEYGGRRLNSPNDVVEKSDGTIWFTDPTYGILSNFEGNRAEPEQPTNQVFCFDPQTSTAKPVSDIFVQPNGLAFSRDERTLYVAESGRSHDDTVPAVLKVFDVTDDNELANPRDFAEITPGVPDGLRVDYLDNIWISSADGVQCFDRSGRLLGKIFVPEVVSNLTFGGPRNTHLFITATTSLYAVHVNTQA